MALLRPERKVVSRRAGRSVVAAAAYRSADCLSRDVVDVDTGIVGSETIDYSRKHNVLFSEIIAPDHAPDWVYDRSKLWNAVEHSENRKDAQLAYEMQVSFPNELDKEHAIRLVREMCLSHYVADGMVADASIHWEDGNHHAHILLTTRDISVEDGFGKKNRTWRGRSWIYKTRKDWETVTNKYLARQGLDVRVDVSSYKAQGIDQRPMISKSLDASKLEEAGVDTNVVAINRDIHLDNLKKIESDPSIILAMLSKEKSVFTDEDIYRALSKKSLGDEVWVEQQYAAVMTHAELVQTSRRDLRGNIRYGYRPHVDEERGMFASVGDLSADRSKALSGKSVDALESHLSLLVANSSLPSSARDASLPLLSEEQAKAVRHVLVGTGNIALIDGKAGTGKSSIQKLIVEHMESEGYRVRGTSLSGIATKNIASEAGISADTIAALRLKWASGRERLTSKDVLIVDEAGMVGSSDMALLVKEAKESGAKLILVGDNEQLQPITMGQAFRGIMDRVGAESITQVFRQRDAWQQQATELFAEGDVSAAIALYDRHGRIREDVTKEAAIGRLSDDYVKEIMQSSKATQLVMAHTNKDVSALNVAIRSKLAEAGVLKGESVLSTASGKQAFAVGDRLLFLENEKKHLKVSNGTIGTIASIHGTSVTVLVDKRAITFDTSEYNSFVHGYAVTMHKSQGVTVDKSYILASSGLNENLSYVAASRHRVETTLYTDKETFASREDMVKSMSRSSKSALFSDYDATPEQLERLAPVSAYIATLEEKQTLLRSMIGWAKAESKPLYSHESFTQYQDYKTRVEEQASYLLDHYGEYRKILTNELGIRKDALRYHAGQKQARNQSNGVDTSRALVTQYASAPDADKEQLAFQINEKRHVATYDVDMALKDAGLSLKEIRQDAVSYAISQHNATVPPEGLEPHLALAKAQQKNQDPQADSYLLWVAENAKALRERQQEATLSISAHEREINKSTLKLEQQEQAIIRSRHAIKQSDIRSEDASYALHAYQHEGKDHAEKMLLNKGYELHDISHVTALAAREASFKETWASLQDMKHDAAYEANKEASEDLKAQLGILDDDQVYAGLSTQVAETQSQTKSGTQDNEVAVHVPDVPQPVQPSVTKDASPSIEADGEDMAATFNKQHEEQQEKVDMLEYQVAKATHAANDDEALRAKLENIQTHQKVLKEQIFKKVDTLFKKNDAAKELLEKSDSFDDGLMLAEKQCQPDKGGILAKKKHEEYEKRLRQAENLAAKYDRLQKKQGQIKLPQDLAQRDAVKEEQLRKEKERLVAIEAEMKRKSIAIESQKKKSKSKGRGPKMSIKIGYDYDG